MNFKKLLICTLVVFFGICVSDYLIHGVILRNLYLDTAPLWRPESEMMAYMGHRFFGQFITSFFFSLIFAKGYEGKGMLEGARFGLILGGFEMGQHFVMHAVAPYPVLLTLLWICFGFIQSVFVGIIASLVYGKSKS